MRARFVATSRRYEGQKSNSQGQGLQILSGLGLFRPLSLTEIVDKYRLRFEDTPEATVLGDGRGK